MTLDEAFTELGLRDPERLIDAMHCVLDDWDRAAPRARTLLHAYVAGADLNEATERTLFPILHILAEKCDTAAFADICALLADPERADLIFGEAIVRTMPCILISCYAGDPAPLQAVVDQPDGDMVVREGALMAMAYLAHVKQLPRAVMHAYLTTLHDLIPARTDQMLWVGWVRAVALLGFRALSPRAVAVFERGLIKRDLMRLEDFRAELRMALEDPALLEGFFDVGIGPLGSAVDAMDGDGDSQVPETPFINPLRGIGRNDQCPCGSGKKYKRCCQA